MPSNRLHIRINWVASAAALVAAVWIASSIKQVPSTQIASVPAATPASREATQVRPAAPVWGFSSTQMPAGLAPLSSASEPRNIVINPRALTTNRVTTAAMFLRQVTLVPHPRGGYEVQAVDKGSLYEQMGLRPGDRVFSIDTTDNADIAEDSLDEGMHQTHVEMQVYRDGQFVTLGVEL